MSLFAYHRQPIDSYPEHGYEYLDGRIYMMTGGSPDHSILGSNMTGILRDHLRNSRCIVSNSDIYLQLSDRYRVCPDITVSCDPRDRGAQDVIRYPSRVVDVLSPTTEARDRGQKSLQYRACPRIQEYVLISSEILLVEVFRHEKHGFWILYTLGSDDIIELNSLGISFTVAEIYQNTSLTDSPQL